MTDHSQRIQETEADEECGLCGGCGEVEVDRRDTLTRDTVPCPECIAREIAEERKEHQAQLDASLSRERALREALKMFVAWDAASRPFAITLE